MLCSVDVAVIVFGVCHFSNFESLLTSVSCYFYFVKRNDQATNVNCTNIVLRTSGALFSNTSVYVNCPTIPPLLQIQLQYDGESDTRGPGDFSGSSSTKNDDGEYAEEDDGEEEDDIPSSATRKRARGEDVTALNPNVLASSFFSPPVEY